MNNHLFKTPRICGTCNAWSPDTTQQRPPDSFGEMVNNVGECRKGPRTIITSIIQMGGTLERVPQEEQKTPNGFLTEWSGMPYYQPGLILTSISFQYPKQFQNDWCRQHQFTQELENPLGRQVRHDVFQKDENTISRVDALKFNTDNSANKK